MAKEVKKVSADEFIATFGEVTELNNPCKLYSAAKEHSQAPFVTYKLAKDSRDQFGILETAQLPGLDLVEGSSSLVRVIYDKYYGLKAKKIIQVACLENTEELLISGQVKYNFDKLHIALSTGLRIPFLVTEKDLRRPEAFGVVIDVLPNSGDLNNQIPLAEANYDPSRIIQMSAEFPNAEFQEVLDGKVESRSERYGHRLIHQATYFQWEYLVGAKIGSKTFEDAESADLKYQRRLATINDSSPTQVVNTPYLGKITHSSFRIQFGEGRLRFARKNPETGEVWMFSIPEAMDRKDFAGDLMYEPLSEFSRKYPVVFCVKQPEEARQWFSTYHTNDIRR